MTVSGYPSQPSILLADAAALAASTTSSPYSADCTGRDRAVIGVLCDKSHSIYVGGAGSASGSFGQLYDSVGTKQQALTIAGGASWNYFVVDVSALSKIGVWVLNNDGAAAATLSVEITLI